LSEGRLVEYFCDSGESIQSQVSCSQIRLKMSAPCCP
jgi:hypothetical protein